MNEILSRAQEYVSLEQHADFRQEIVDLLASNNTSELRERFYTTLSFGTGGIRGVMGGGFNRINPLVIQRTTRGLARYILSRKIPEPSVAIAYDSRNNSPLFAQTAAQVLAAQGIKVYLFSSLRPTPELSFAIRELRCTSGIVCTASHNPPAYNGYKVYWQDGAQIVYPEDEGIINEVRSVSGQVDSMDLNEAVQSGYIQYIDKEIDEKYCTMVTSMTIRKELFSTAPTHLNSSSSASAAPSFIQDLSIVYTPLHGTGAYIMNKACSALGLRLDIVPEQAEPNGNFPTVAFPNPEEPDAMRLALEHAKRTKADLVIGTDPDADRIGIAVRRASTNSGHNSAQSNNSEHGQSGSQNQNSSQNNERYQLLNGNEHGVLLCDYIFSSLSELQKLPERPAFVNTIVSTDLQRRIARKYGAEVYETLTGFKWIASKIREFEHATEAGATSAPQYILGGEESYGFMIGTQVRDKDSISASILTIEMTLHYKKQGKTLLDRLAEIHEEFGLYQESLMSRSFEGENGIDVMKAIMAGLRNNPPASIAGIDVQRIRDILDNTILNCETGEKSAGPGLPSSNVLQFFLADGSLISARPSGTEPKIKFYTSVKDTPKTSETRATEHQQNSNNKPSAGANSNSDLAEDSNSPAENSDLAEDSLARSRVQAKIHSIEAFIDSLIQKEGK